MFFFKKNNGLKTIFFSGFKSLLAKANLGESWYQIGWRKPKSKSPANYICLNPLNQDLGATFV